MSTTRVINFMSNNSDLQELHNHNENHSVSIAIKILKDDMSSLMDIDKLSICSILAARSKAGFPLPDYLMVRRIGWKIGGQIGQWERTIGRSDAILKNWMESEGL